MFDSAAAFIHDLLLVIHTGMEHANPCCHLRFTEFIRVPITVHAQATPLIESGMVATALMSS
jgi:hypothetical protein